MYADNNKLDRLRSVATDVISEHNGNIPYAFPAAATARTDVFSRLDSRPGQDFRGFPQSLKANKEMIRLSQSDHDRFLPNPFHFITSNSTIRRYRVCDVEIDIK
jgi:hypothetical protein